MMMKLGLVLAFLCIGSAFGDYPFGSYWRPFNAQSMWNCKPVNPVFAPNVSVPTSYYYPAIQSGTWSTGVFLANASDPPQTIYGPNGTQINNVDNLAGLANLTLPHFNEDAIPASGGDGHCDVLDVTTGVLHSFWQLRKNNVTGVWTTVQYAWSPIDGYGWGQPDHYYQGARAAGVPTSAGILRIHEVNDGLPLYRHALAMSMTYNGLGKDPTYVYPATSSDSDAQWANYGYIPEGSLVMLPNDFNLSFITSPALLKVANTLQVYGAYVVDRNDGTPYEIYVENGADFHMSNKSWDPVIANELQVIRAGLKLVQSVDYFEDGNGNPLQPYKNVNLLSMRGSVGPTAAWQIVGGDAGLEFDTWSQSLVFTSNSKETWYQNWSGLGYNRVSWAAFKPNTNYTFFVEATANITVGIAVQYNQTASGLVYKGNLGDGQSHTFTWGPKLGCYLVVYCFKPPGPAGSGRGFLMETDNMAPPYVPAGIKPLPHQGSNKISVF